MAILAPTSALSRPTTVKMPNLALIETKRTKSVDTNAEPEALVMKLSRLFFPQLGFKKV